MEEKVATWELGHCLCGSGGGSVEPSTSWVRRGVRPHGLSSGTLEWARSRSGGSPALCPCAGAAPAEQSASMTEVWAENRAQALREVRFLLMSTPGFSEISLYGSLRYLGFQSCFCFCIGFKEAEWNLLFGYSCWTGQVLNMYFYFIFF